MSLADYAKTKALNFIENMYNQADPSINTLTGSAVRATVILPSALIYAAVFQDIEVLRNLYLGNFSNINEQDMDLLAGLQDRPQGSRSSTTLRVYLENLEGFTLEAFPYFQSVGGAQYRPIRRTEFNVSDILEDGGEIYVNVPVISTIFGPESAAEAGEISEFSNLPIEVTRITNINATQGGNPQASNEEFFDFLQDTLNDRTLNQIGGIRQFIQENLPEVAEVKVVPAGDDLMIRDEVWTSDGTNPNLDRDGEPFASHTDLGTLDFDAQFGRAVATGGPFSSSDVGKRVAVSGDLEKFRVILKFIDSNTVVLSGHPQEGTASAKIYGQGPQIQIMADVYLYFPAVQIQSTVVDKRFFLVTTQNQSTPVTKIYYDTAEGFSYTSIPSSGKLVLNEGTSNEEVLVVTSSGADATGTFFTLEQERNSNISLNTPLSLYDMDEIEIGTDILDRPVLYVLQIDQLDPLSFETVGTLERTAPGSYDDPGWYISNTDPAEVFSSREEKSIILDEKRDENAFADFTETGVNITDSVSIFTGDVEDTTGDNILAKPVDWSNTEGREVTVTIPNKTLADETGGVTGAAVSAGAGTDTLTVTGLDIEYATLLGYRDDVRVKVYDNVPTLISTYEMSEVMAYGDKLKLKTGTFNASADTVDVILPFHYTQDELDTSQNPPATDDIAWGTTAASPNDFFPEDEDDAPQLLKYNGSIWDPEDFATTVDAVAHVRGETIETIVLSTDGVSTIEVLYDPGLPIFADAGGLTAHLVTVSGTGDAGAFTSNPVRVVYATHSDFASLQTTLDEGDIQLLCKDTLVRSMLPTLIDATINYTGTSTSEEVYTRFIELLEEVPTEIEEGQRIRLDMSNIIAALDEEGLTDSIDVDFEIRVTNFLADGEFEVRYLNPSESTKQALAVDATTSAGADRITLKRLKSTAAIPGRGKLFLGGNNPSTQELLPYEAVIDNQDDTFTFLFRAQQTTDFTHNEWETAIVAVRDYDTELEFTDGAIFIPANNRPYVRQLVVIKG